MNSDVDCNGDSITILNGQTLEDLAGTRFQDSLSSDSCVGEFLPAETITGTSLSTFSAGSDLDYVGLSCCTISTGLATDVAVITPVKLNATCLR